MKSQAGATGTDGRPVADRPADRRRRAGDALITSRACLRSPGRVLIGSRVLWAVARELRHRVPPDVGALHPRRRRADDRVCVARSSSPPCSPSSARWVGCRPTRSSTAIASLYVSLVRGTPLLVQIFFWLFALAELGIVLPAVLGGHHRARLQLRRLHDGDLPCRHPGRAPRPARGRRGARHAGAPGHAPDRPAAGHPHRHPGHRQRVHRDDQGHVARVRHRRSRSCCGGPSRPAARPHIMEALLFAAAVYWVLTIVFSFLPGAPGAAHGAGRSLMAAAARSVVSATGIEKYFGEQPCAARRGPEVRQHETVMLIGRSGSGKTTFLRCLNFLEEPTVGTVRIGDIRSRPIRCTLAAGRTGSRSASCGCGRHGVPGVQPVPAHDRAPELHRGADAGQGRAARPGHRDGRALPGEGPADRQARRVPVTPVGRPEAARGHRPGAVHGAPGAAVR